MDPKRLQTLELNQHQSQNMYFSNRFEPQQLKQILEVLHTLQTPKITWYISVLPL